MELSSYFSILQRRKWIVILSTLLGLALAAAFTFLSTPQYVASTTVRVLTVGGGTMTSARPDISYTERLVNTYSRIITGNKVRREIMDQLGLEKLPIISVQSIVGTELIRVVAEATDPEDARDIANAAAQVLVDQNREFYSGGAGQTLQEILGEQLEQAEQALNEARANHEKALEAQPPNEAAVAAAREALDVRDRTYASLLTQYEAARLEEAVRRNAISIIEEANTPNRPAKPRHVINLALGLAIGLVGGVALALLAENLDTTLYTAEQIESATQMETIGQIPTSKDDLAIARLGAGHYPQLESFRRLRTNILASGIDGSQVALLTSARRGEGKSTVAANLAVTIAQSGREVVVVDCDLRLPTVHKLFDIPNKRGLTNILAGEVQLDEAIQYSSYPRVQVLTSGPLPPNPTELLGSQRMLDLIDQLKGQYDFIILDTPALLSVADAAVLAPAVDNVILVVAQSQTRRGDVQTVRRQLANVRVKSMEVVVNRAEPNGSYAYYESEAR
ncbi:MAG TPA: polysaccharide biosynthesis tyrosine autokinase [Promineifilum sp.]|nr:polysaccharide biosynthesis tyrosine autokinase [Promineifilum sp.]HRO23051.1 polysaccharide biosynthesis tyrosine autokinase [Promineifilum sp.]HRO90046.1 polysaccharide biosynthesis tyrosine autokinase [Promineifilum sp.]HRQ11722.1 polysaccharide biosynthesis tyrosine autokinase [Promineifilum sp.]